MKTGSSTILKFLFFSFLSVAIMIMDHRGDGPLENGREALSALVYPVQAAVDLPFSLWNGFIEGLISRDKLLEENEALKKKTEIYEARMQELYFLEQDNKKLREVMKTSQLLSQEFIFAELVYIAHAPSRREVMINRGSEDSVYVGQPVIAKGHIYGQVVEVSLKTSKVMLITDIEHEIPVEREDGTLTTVAAGTGDDALLEIRYVHTDKITKGDLFRSSGLGDVYPAGFPVGRVVDVEYQNDKQFLTVRAEPLIELGRIREVLLVSSQTRSNKALTGEAEDVDTAAVDAEKTDEKKAKDKGEE